MNSEQPCEVIEPGELPGEPDALQRLWTPYRMVYIQGESKPADDGAGQCPFCRAPQRSDSESLIVHRGRSAFVICNLYPYNPGHVLVCSYRHVSSYVDLDRQEIIVSPDVNLGIAAATQRGLVVPNIKSAQDMNLLELALALNVLVT